MVGTKKTEHLGGRRVSSYARTGETNGKAKLSNAQIRLLRTLRITLPTKPSYKELGDIFDLNPRQVNRICTGEQRVDAGGPIEMRVKCLSEIDEDEDVPPSPPFDEFRWIKCPGCGNRAHPSTANEQMCYGCVLGGREC
jgi:hypothetical protein